MGYESLGFIATCAFAANLRLDPLPSGRRGRGDGVRAGAWQGSLFTIRVASGRQGAVSRRVAVVAASVAVASAAAASAAAATASEVALAALYRLAPPAPGPGALPLGAAAARCLGSDGGQVRHARSSTPAGRTPPPGGPGSGYARRCPAAVASGWRRRRAGGNGSGEEARPPRPIRVAHLPGPIRVGRAFSSLKSLSESAGPVRVGASSCASCGGGVTSSP